MGGDNWVWNINLTSAIFARKSLEYINSKRMDLCRFVLWNLLSCFSTFLHCLGASQLHCLGVRLNAGAALGNRHPARLSLGFPYVLKTEDHTILSLLLYIFVNKNLFSWLPSHCSRRNLRQELGERV